MTEFTTPVNSIMIKFNKILILIEFNYIGAFDYIIFCNEAFDCDRFYYTNNYPWDYLASNCSKADGLDMNKLLFICLTQQIG